MMEPTRKARVAFIGNCQAQALGSLANHLGLPIEVTPMPAVFDLPAFGSSETWRRVQSCDFIFNQRVAEDYPVEFARPAFLSDKFGQHSISWPNVYFDGYFPGIEYLYSYSGKIVGPLADYHFSFVRSAWSAGASIETLMASFLDGELAWSFRHGAERSLNELRQRESGLTVRISDWLAARWRHRKLMYVMNHPDNDTLLELLRRLLNATGLEMAVDPGRLSTYPYTLNEILLPAFPAVHRHLALGFGATERIKGKLVEFSANSVTVQTAEHHYDWRELFETYYRQYDVLSTGSSEVKAILQKAPTWSG